MSQERSIAFYYGHGELQTFSHYRHVVLQPDHYSAEELAWLRERGVQPLAYLSLGEEFGPPAPWHRGELNLEWGTSYVDLTHPGWTEARLSAVRRYRAQGFAGVFLDTLDVVDLYPEERPAMLSLIARVQSVTCGGYVLANRGFSLLPELAEFVDGVVFESFSVAWSDSGAGCRMLSADELEINSRLAQQLSTYDLDLYALDYTSSDELAAFARTRAALHGFGWFSSNRAVTYLPNPQKGNARRY